MKRLILMPVLLCLAFAAPSLAQSASLPENGDFETVDYSQKAKIAIANEKVAEKLGTKQLQTDIPVIKNCDLGTYGMPGKISLDKETKVSGTQSLRIDCKKGERVLITMVMPAKAMQLYKATIWVKRSEPVSAEVALAVWSDIFKSCGQTQFKELSSAAEKKDGFSKMEYVFSSKEDAKGLRFNLVVSNFTVNDTVTVWFDDFKVEEVKE